MKAAKEVTKFYIAGITTSTIQLGLLYLLTDLAGLWYILAAVIAGVISVTINYKLNRSWVFGYSGNKKQVVQYASFWVTRIISIAIQVGILFLLVEYNILWYIYAAVVSIAIASFANYGFNKYLIFRSDLPPAEEKPI